MESPVPGRRPALRERLERALDASVRAFPRWDGTLYAAYVCGAVLFVASLFYGHLLLQTRGSWSAPLDDVFIHFDYARASARGSWFQWTEGNGYSSGNTSLLYPLVLACGYLSGFRGTSLMVFAAGLAIVGTWAFLVAAGRLLDPLGRWSKYLLPPVVLCIGALDWTLFSGMENALHLALWGLLLLSVLRLELLARAGRPLAFVGWVSGLLGALLYATRPESVVCLGAFALFAVHAAWRSPGAASPRREGLRTALRLLLPGVLALLAQTVANRVFTGEWSANGAICKLTLNNPYMHGEAKLREYFSHLEYVVRRNTEHHFSDGRLWGWAVPLLGLLPLGSKALRARALLLWAQVVGWLLLVALNGQVRWQNERYTMPAVAWALILATMGLGLLLRSSLGSAGAVGRTPSVAATLGWTARLAGVLGLSVVFWQHQAPRFLDQVWFFGRASRNIRDQHLVAGQVLGRLGPHRILVGDAGALLYASDRRGLDLIGLGGYHALPFARAGVHGLGASLELIERMPSRERPDMMALYPSWWGELPGIFGKRITEVPVAGNVICGGASKVLYRSDWSALEPTGESLPFGLGEAEVVVDELDQADLVSERAHSYSLPRPDVGFVGFRVLPRARSSSRDELFDAGRIVPPGETEEARLELPTQGGRLIVRTVSSGAPFEVRAWMGDRELGLLQFTAEPGWQEASLALPVGLPGKGRLRLQSASSWWLDAHLWVVAGEATGAFKTD